MVFKPGQAQPEAMIVEGVAGNAVTAGYAVVANASTSKFTHSAGAKPTGAIGIALDSAASDKAVRVALAGKVSAVAAGAIKKFNFVSVASSGKVEAATVDTDYIIGIALEEATAADDVILVKICPNFINKAGSA